jgi:hypothetical protein
MNASRKLTMSSGAFAMTPAVVFCMNSCLLTISGGAMHRTVQGGAFYQLMVTLP